MSNKIDSLPEELKSIAKKMVNDKFKETKEEPIIVDRPMNSAKTVRMCLINDLEYM